jgi:hypothetical protein
VRSDLVLELEWRALIPVDGTVLSTGRNTEWATGTSSAGVDALIVTLDRTNVGSRVPREGLGKAVVWSTISPRIQSQQAGLNGAMDVCQHTIHGHHQPQQHEDYRQSKRYHAPHPKALAPRA